MNSNTLSNTENINSKNVLLLGAADGIGLALSKILEKKNYNVYVTSRKTYSSSLKIKYFQLMATEEKSWLKFTNILDEENIVFDLIINTIGILQDKENDVIPEKSIKNFNSASFIKNIEKRHPAIYGFVCLQKSAPQESAGRADEESMCMHMHMDMDIHVEHLNVKS